MSSILCGVVIRRKENEIYIQAIGKPGVQRNLQKILSPSVLKYFKTSHIFITIIDQKKNVIQLFNFAATAERLFVHTGGKSNHKLVQQSGIVYLW